MNVNHLKKKEFGPLFPHLSSRLSWVSEGQAAPCRLVPWSGNCDTPASLSGDPIPRGLSGKAPPGGSTQDACTWALKGSEPVSTLGDALHLPGTESDQAALPSLSGWGPPLLLRVPDPAVPMSPQPGPLLALPPQALSGSCKHSRGAVGGEGDRSRARPEHSQARHKAP